MCDFLKDLFDLNGDGEVDAFEKSGEMRIFSEVMYGNDNLEDNDDDDFDLEMAGFDRDELEYMDEDERAEALENAGLDPDDYDF